jgi:hypothetical protein
MIKKEHRDRTVDELVDLYQKELEAQGLTGADKWARLAGMIQGHFSFSMTWMGTKKDIQQSLNNVVNDLEKKLTA